MIGVNDVSTSKASIWRRNAAVENSNNGANKGY